MSSFAMSRYVDGSSLKVASKPTPLQSFERALRMPEMYLHRNELAALIGCKETSYTCMRRWLENNEWPYAVSISGFPKVSRAYHNQRMQGGASRPGKVSNTPDFDALKNRNKVA